MTLNDYDCASGSIGQLTTLKEGESAYYLEDARETVSKLPAKVLTACMSPVFIQTKFAERLF